jgi:beta-fructofuranosidase
VRWSRRNFLQGLSSLAAFRGMHVADLFAFRHDDKPPKYGLAADPLRPQFHLLPAGNWMNDPDGPIFWNGQYHMFYQFNPGAAVWGDMHWAHAVSPDMVHWKHLPVALAPTAGGADQDGCFSGSVVKDGDTATVLYTGVKSVAPAQATLRDGTHNFLETQCLATSRDSLLRTWEKLPKPVLLPPNDPKLTGFRDPCLWRDGNIWYMGIGSGQRGVGGCVLLYHSSDLRKWEYLHPLVCGKGNGKQTADFVDSGEMWECPDFFALGKKQVLLYSTERRVYWQTGEFDRKELVFHPEKTGELDSGAFYAPKSQLDERGRRILWGWIPETRPEAECSAAGWAGCMSLPRVLTLNLDNGLSMEFLPELALLRSGEFSLMDRSRETAPLRREALKSFALPETSAACEIVLQRPRLELSLVAGDNSWLNVSFDQSRTSQELRLGDRAGSVPAAASHRIKLFLDASVVECIVDDSSALTTRIYAVPGRPLHVVVREPDLDGLVELRFFTMKPISPDRLTS